MIHLRAGQDLTACGLNGQHMSPRLDRVRCRNCLNRIPKKDRVVIHVPDNGLGILKCNLCGGPLSEHRMDEHL